ncbi:MAG: DNA-3-methyladenine glycosylase I, partial [Methanobrevibacter sp.]
MDEREFEDGKNRCFWCNNKNELYIKYHDEEWGVLNLDEDYLFEMLILESFQSGLSWETILNKRESFRKAFDNFDIDTIINYDNKKVENLLNDKGIIRNRRKINATINNARIFKNIQKEFGSFHDYLMKFIPDGVIYDSETTESELPKTLSKD